jgi:hypothetical protein
MDLFQEKEPLSNQNHSLILVAKEETTWTINNV